jgi:hypothetical protein
LAQTTTKPSKLYFVFFLFFFVERVIKTITKKSTRERVEIYEPKEATIFQPAKASGKSGILRGIPAKPKKCIGKKVKFTPIKNNQKWILPNTSG